MSHLDRHGQPVSFGSARFRNRVVPGFLVTEATFPSNGTLPSHFHDRAVVATTFRGGFESRISGRPYWSTNAMTIVEPAGERHANRFGTSGATVLALQPDPSREDMIRTFATWLSTPRHLGDTALGLLARRLSVEIGATDSAAPIAIEGLALELLATAARCAQGERDATSPWLLRVRDRLHDDEATTPSLQELARIAQVHPGHLTRAFRAAFGRSIGAYLRDLRLQRSADRLLATRAPLALIASEAGFADQSHFTRLFRTQFGCPPGAFRRRARA